MRRWSWPRCTGTSCARAPACCGNYDPLVRERLTRRTLRLVICNRSRRVTPRRGQHHPPAGGHQQAQLSNNSRAITTLPWQKFLTRHFALFSSDWDGLRLCRSAHSRRRCSASHSTRLRRARVRCRIDWTNLPGSLRSPATPLPCKRYWRTPAA